MWTALRREPELDAQNSERVTAALPIGKDSDPLAEVAAQLAELSLALGAHQNEQVVM